jgi:hypothetical protein
MTNQVDPLERFHSSISRWEVLVYIIIAATIAIIYDRFISSGHLQLISFSVLLTVFYLRIFRNALSIVSVPAIIGTALMTNILLSLVVPKENSGLPAIASVPVIIAEFSIVYIIINASIKRRLNKD